MNFSPEQFQNLPEEHQQAFMASLEHMQVRDTLKSFNGLVERCFKDCVADFRSKALDSTEEKCVHRCCEKFINLSGRVNLRYQDLVGQMEQQAAGK